MATAARKARKRAGIKWTPKPAKVPTPFEQRSWFTGMFVGVPGTKYAGQLVPRSAQKRERALRVRELALNGRSH